MILGVELAFLWPRLSLLGLERCSWRWLNETKNKKDLKHHEPGVNASSPNSPCSKGIMEALLQEITGKLSLSFIIWKMSFKSKHWVGLSLTQALPSRAWTLLLKVTQWKKKKDLKHHEPDKCKLSQLSVSKGKNGNFLSRRHRQAEPLHYLENEFKKQVLMTFLFELNEIVCNIQGNLCEKVVVIMPMATQLVTYPAVHTVAEIWQWPSLLAPERGHHIARIRDSPAFNS